MLRLALSALLLALATLAIASSDATRPARITVVVDDNYPPYVFRDQSGKLDGYLVDEWQLWQKKTGVVVDLQGMDWTDALARMKIGQADVIDTIFETAERETWLDFTPPYANIPVPIFAQVSIGGIVDTATLPGFLVGVKAGDACATKLAAAGITSLRSYMSYSDLIRGAVSAEIKVFCLDEPPAAYLLYKAGASKDFHKAFTLYTGQFHRAVHKGDQATLQLVSKGFSSISAQELKQLHDKWMGTSLTAPWTRNLMYGSAAILLIVAILAGWSVLLRRQVHHRTQQLDNERIRLHTVLSTLPDLIWLKDINGVYLACNRAFERLFDAAEKDIIGKTDYDFVDKELADSFRKNDAAALALGGPRTNEEWLYFPEKDYRGLFETTKTPLYDARGKVIGVLGIAHDITVLMQSREALDFLAHHDPLTRLPNRLLFRDRLEHAIRRAARDNAKLALLFVDLDRFKNVNDALGHMIGDELLLEVAKRMSTQIRTSDTLARLSGDEFIFLLEEEVSSADIVAVAEKILALFAEPWTINKRTLFIGASIGIARYPVDGTTADVLIKHADMAMYRAKEAGRNTFRFFEAVQSDDAMERMLLQNMLRGAIERNELLLHYQPQIEIQSNRLIGVEALLRWQHPELGMVAPNRFIPIAEEIGIIAELGDWVVRECCRQLAQWRDADVTVPRVAINFSVQQIERKELAA